MIWSYLSYQRLADVTNIKNAFKFIKIFGDLPNHCNFLKLEHLFVCNYSRSPLFSNANFVEYQKNNNVWGKVSQSADSAIRIIRILKVGSFEKSMTWIVNYIYNWETCSRVGISQHITTIRFMNVELPLLWYPCNGELNTRSDWTITLNA